MKPIRRIFMLLLAMTLITCLCGVAFAEEISLPDGILIGDATGLNTDAEGKYLITADDVKPGDVIKRTLSIANYEEGGGYWLYLRTTEVETEGKINWGKESFLKLYLDGELIYEGCFLGDGGDTVKFKGNGKEFTDTPLELGFFRPGEQRRLDAELYIDGSQLDYWTLSEPSKTTVYWDFSASFIEDTKPTTPGTTKKPEKPAKPGPDTGDVVRTGLYILLGAVLGGIVVLLLIKRKLKDDEKAPEHASPASAEAIKNADA